MSSIAFISQKGGVGKTNIAVNLSYSLARRGWRVLLVDADLQGGVGFSLTEKARNIPGYYDYLSGAVDRAETPLRETILKTNLPELDLLTRGSSQAVDAILADESWSWCSAAEVQGLAGEFDLLDYDLILYDTPTGASPLTMNLCRLVDFVMVPQEAKPLCIRSLPQMLRVLASLRRVPKGERAPALGGFILSMTDLDDPSNLAEQQEFRDLLPSEMVMETVIPEHRDYQEATRRGIPVAMLGNRPTSASLIFDQLAAEVEQRLQLLDEEPKPITETAYERLVD